MIQLPNEIVLKLCEFASVHDVLSLQSVNTRFRDLLVREVWSKALLKISDNENDVFDQDSMKSPKTDIVFEIKSNEMEELVRHSDSPYLASALQELQYLTVQCSSDSLKGGLENFLQKLYSKNMLPNLKQIDVFSTIKSNQPTALFDFLDQFPLVTANLYLDAQTALVPNRFPSNVNRLVLSTIKGTELFDLHDIIHSQYLNNVESLHLVTDKNHPITKQQLMTALEQSRIKSLAVTPHCVECDDDNLHWDLPNSVEQFELHVPSFDQEWSPSKGSIRSDKLVSLKVPSNGENRLYNMRFRNLKQLHLEGTIKDAFKLPPGIESFCEHSAALEQLQLSGFSMSDVSQIVNQFQSSLRSVILQNTVANGREYNVYQWMFLPNLEFMVVDYSPLANNRLGTTKRLLQSAPRTVKMYIIDHSEAFDDDQDSEWCATVEDPVVFDGISQIDLLEGVDHTKWSAAAVDRAAFLRHARQLEL